MILDTTVPVEEGAIVLSWAGDRASTSGASQSGSGESDPTELPPSYEAAHIPTEPVQYTFSQQSFNTMLLLPPYDYQDTRPLYHISVVMNCFIPSSYITTIRREGSEFGDYVAEFEMGDSEDLDTVTVHGKQRTIGAHLEKVSGSRAHGPYTLAWRGRLKPQPTGKLVSLTWETNGNVKKCAYNLVGSKAKPKDVAKWVTPPRIPLQSGMPKAPNAITLLPAAYEHQGLLDQIILSGLIIERQRLATRK